MSAAKVQNKRRRAVPIVIARPCGEVHHVEHTGCKLLRRRQRTQSGRSPGANPLSAESYRLESRWTLATKVPQHETKADRRPTTLKSHKHPTPPRPHVRVQVNSICRSSSFRMIPIISCRTPIGTSAAQMHHPPHTESTVSQCPAEE